MRISCSFKMTTWQTKENVMSEKIQLFLLICIVFASSALTFMPPKPQEPIYREFTSPQNGEKTITVFGNGEISVKLDTVEFVIFIQTVTYDLIESKSKNDEKFLTAMSILDTHAIEKKDIILENPQEKVRLIDIGHVVTRLVKVTLHDIAKFQPLITDLQEGGVEQIIDIVFSASNIDSYYEQALQLAIEAARKKAQATVVSLNRNIGEIISIKESSGKLAKSRVYYPSLKSFFNDTTSNKVKQASTSFIGVTIHTEVTVKFELK